MDKDLTVTTVHHHHRPSYTMSGCMMSPSCFPVNNNEFQYSRIHYSPIKSRRGWRWRRILRKLMREKSKINLCRSKPVVSFQYDPVSYSQNFDEGCHLQEPTRLSHVFQDVSAAAFHRLDSQCKIEGVSYKSVK